MLTTDEANHYWCGLFIQNESFLRFFWKTTIIVNALCFTKMSWRWHEAKSKGKGTKIFAYCAMSGQEKSRKPLFFL